MVEVVSQTGLSRAGRNTQGVTLQEFGEDLEMQRQQFL